MLKILPARLQQYVNYELLDVQSGFRKGTGLESQVIWWQEMPAPSPFSQKIVTEQRLCVGGCAKPWDPLELTVWQESRHHADVTQIVTEIRP